MNACEQRKLAYAEAIAQLRLHPGLIWTRNNFFLLINSGLLAFSRSDAAADFHTSPFLIPAAGLFLSAIWIWVTWAGRHLQRQWRKVVLALEAELFKAEEGQPEVQGPFTRAAATAKEGATWLVSINTALLILSGGFFACWGYLLTLAFAASVCTAAAAGPSLLGCLFC